MQQTAASENRDLNEGEQQNAAVIRGEVEALASRIESQSSLERGIAATQAALATIPAGGTETQPKPGMPAIVRTTGRHEDAAEIVRSMWPTPGDYMHDIIHAHQGDHDARERIQRALQNEVIGDVPGLVPEPIVGTVINIIDASRPVVASMRSYPMPQYGSSFTRPKVTQHTQVGPQAAQKTELPSRKFLVNPLNVTKQTLGGAIDVAFQVIDWTNPSALNAITDDLADQYAIQTEALACAVIEAAGDVTPDVVSSADTFIADLYTAAAQVYAGCGRLPDTVYASVDVWALLGGLVDTTGRPLFGNLSPSNSPGTYGGITSFAGSPLNARLVVSPAFTTETLIVAASQFAEVYEDRRGALRVVEPKLLGWEIAYYGYFASLATIPEAFVNVAPPPIIP
jgi:HK97 family phage major capsid protein